MNIIDIQDNLKDFSENQLIKEMQRPSGNVPQFLVLSEITRRKRMRDQFKTDQAAREQSVAQEAVAAAGVPQSGIMGMSEAMAPKASMAEGGIGSVMSAPMKAPMGAMPMSEGGIMSMSAGGASKPRIEERRMKSGKIGLFQGNTFLGTKKDRDDDGDSLASKIGFGGDRDIIGSIRDVLGFEEGGVIKAQNGLPLGLRQRNPGNIRPGAGFIGETGQGSGYSTFASDDEGLRAIQRLLMTYGDEYGLNTIRGLANRYAPKSENPTESYIDFLSQKTGIGPDEEIDLAGRGSDLIPAIVGFEQGQQPFSQAQIDRAIRAAGTDDPDMVKQILAEDLAPQEKVTSNFSLMDALFPKAQAATMDTAEQQVDDEPTVASRGRNVSRRRNRSTPDTSLDDVIDIDASAVFDSPFGPRVPDQIGPRSEDQQIRDATLLGRALQDDPDVDQDETPTSRGRNVPRTVDIERILQNRADALDLPSRGRNVPRDPIERSDTDSDGSLLRDTDAGASTVGKSVATGGADATDAITGTTTDPSNLILSDAAGTGAGQVTSLEAEIKAMQDKLKKDRETDKYLALAQAGLALMSSKNPRLLGAIGEAGVSGLKAMREAQERYNEGVVDLINARAKLRKKTDKGGITVTNAISRVNKIDSILRGEDATIPIDGLTPLEIDRYNQEKRELQKLYLPDILEQLPPELRAPRPQTT